MSIQRPLNEEAYVRSALACTLFSGSRQSVGWGPPGHTSLTALFSQLLGYLFEKFWFKFSKTEVMWAQHWGTRSKSRQLGKWGQHEPGQKKASSPSSRPG